MRKLFLLLAGILICYALSYAQTNTISGKITDPSGAPLFNVSVKIKGTSVGTISNPDGTFTLKTNSAKGTLEISSIGYVTKTVSFTGSQTVNVSLDTDTHALSEVVVTGVGVATSKKKLGISVESITSDKLPPAPTASIDQALVGKIAGAQISSINGSPGASVNILLRGINSLNRGTKPMILLDGVELGATDLTSLDLNMVDRVEVVQGAAAASIYGAQGANGVIQLFTKKGKQGKTNIDISSSVSSNTLLNIGDVHKAKFHSLVTNANNEVIGGSGNPLVFDQTYSHYEENVIWNSLDPTNKNDKLYNKNLQYYDHYKMFFQSANTLNNSISISGGRERSDYNITASDNRQNSNYKGNGDYSRTNISLNFGLELAKNLRFRTITQLAYTHNTLVDPTGRTTMYELNNSRPFADYNFKSADGNYGAYFGDAVGVNGYNPNYTHQYVNVDGNKVDVIQSFDLNYKPFKYLELDAKYGLNYQNEEIVQNIADQSNNLNADYWQYWVEYYPPYYTSYGSPSSKDATGEIDHFRYRTTFQNFLGTATIRADFQKDLHINVPITSSTQLSYDYRKSVNNQYITYGLDAPSYTPYTADQMGQFKTALDRQTPFVTYGYLLNQRFEYGDIAGISGGFRSDYSSAFGRGSKPSTFPRGDAYIRISAMNFWNGKLADVITEFKLRGAYGKAGIQPKPFDRYVTLNTKNIGSSNAFVFPTANPNPDLSVEVSTEKEFGTDISFKVLNGDWLRNINFSATYWDRTTDNAIWDIDAAPSTGIGTLRDNAFGLASHGIQASLNLAVLSTKSLTWNFTTNFGKQTSKISSVIGQPVVVTSFAGSSNYILKAGEKIGQLYGFLMLHAVDEVGPDGNPYIPKANQGNYTLASNGWVVDKATKQPYVTPTQYSFGDPNPKFNLSLINDFTFKSYFSFSMQWDWIEGSHIYNQTKEWMYRDGISGDYDNPITVEGQTGAWTAFYRGVYAQVSRNGTKSYFYEDASFFRLRNISAAFDFAKYFRIPGFQRLQLVVSGRNLITLTNYTGMDPEVSSGTVNSAFDRGVDHNTIPNLKSWQLGVNLGF
jgi:TonB-linked SusC/RagA family outer membrane protein